MSELSLTLEEKYEKLQDEVNTLKYMMIHHLHDRTSKVIVPRIIRSESGYNVVEEIPHYWDIPDQELMFEEDKKKKDGDE